MTHRSIRPTEPISDSVTPEPEAGALWNLVPDALLAVESNGRIAAANQAAARMFGADAETLVGHTVEALIDESARSEHVRHRNSWTRVHTPRHMGSRPAFSARTLDGRRIDVQVALNPIQIDGRQVTIAVVRDVSHNTALLREQANARDEISQRLFGLGMSLRSVIPTVEATEPARRIAAVVDGMSDVVETLGYESRGDSAAPPRDHGS
jgi:PAS domain S-box-containing protein